MRVLLLESSSFPTQPTHPRTHPPTHTWNDPLLRAVHHSHEPVGSGLRANALPGEITPNEVANEL